jgi:GNAT superfamily N-acetyltransferase
MHRLPSNAPNPPPDAVAAFAQGADLHLADASAVTALWWTQTPTMEGERIGCIGAFGATDRRDARNVLEGAVEALLDRRCTLAIGPMNGNTWRRHRFVTSSDGRLPFYLEPENPPEFVTDFTAAGFVPLAEYSSSIVDLTRSDRPDFSAVAQRMQSTGITIRPLNPRSVEADLHAIYRLSLEAFARNYLYTPLAEAEFMAAYLPIVRQIDPRWLLLAEGGGELAGFVFSLPDPLAVQQRVHPALIVKTLAVRPDRRSAGLGSVLLDRVQGIAREAGFRETIHALQHEKNTSLRVGGRFHARVFRRYTLFARRLAPPEHA